MKLNKQQVLSSLCCPCLLLALAVPAAHAQSKSVVPFTESGYVGLNVGKPSHGTPCGLNTLLVCDDPKASFRLYTGGMFNPYFGMELGYINAGNADRGGGTTKAHGLDLNLVGRVPLGEKFSAYARGGAAYGRTKVSADVTSGLATGSASGWGKTYGGGLSFNVASNSSIVLDWGRTDFRFAGGDRAPVKSTSLGFVQRF